MFNVEQTIIEWRRKLAVEGIQKPAVLDELESHLREDLEREMRAGADAAHAFETASRRLGQGDQLKAEFAKIGRSKEWPVGRVIGASCCLFAALYSMALAPALFTVAELSPGQRMLGISAVGLTLLSILSWRFSHKFLPFIPSRRARATAVGVLSVAGLAWLMIFANLLPNVIVPHAMHHGNSGEHIRGSVLIGLRHAAEAQQLRPVFTIGISLLWAMTLTAVLGAAAYGLEETARRGGKENAHV